jgi:hypothetical protein
MITSLPSISSINEIFIDRILNHLDQFLPYDRVTSHAIKNDKEDSHLEFWRTSLSNIINNVHPYDYYKQVYLLNNEVEESAPLHYSSPLEDQTSAFVYPHSKAAFVSHFYPDLLPSMVNSVLGYMKTTGRMIHVGQGSGKSLIFYPVLFTEDDYLKLIPTSYSDIITATVDINSTIINQQADINYLLKKNQELNLAVQALINENNSLQVSRTQDYLTTWR